VSADRTTEQGRNGTAPAQPAKSLRHELRTPLNQIIGYAELLEEEAQEAGQESSIDDLRRIGTAARHLLDLIDKHAIGATTTGASPEAQPVAKPVAAPAEPPKATEAQRAPATAGPSLELVSEARTPRMLVVDDNELNRDMLSRRLRRQSYEVDTAEDGYVALERIAAIPYDVILLDIMMPGITGLDVLKTVRETRSMSDLPIIMATAKDQSEDTVNALSLGANDYVTKPLDFPVVLARVRTQLSLKRAMEEVRRLADELERRNQFIRKTFGRYLSDDVVAELLETPEGLALGGEERTVTLLMSDLRGFSAVSERLEPEQVVSLLNRYLAVMAEIITRFGGTIDEFIGDAVLALFGAPTQRDDDALRAVACAVAMQQAMDDINRESEKVGLPAIAMGIAVNTGRVVVGNIGSETRAKYGVVGSPVNLTARIESCTLGGQVFVAHTALEAAGSSVETAARMVVDAKGFSEPVAFYEVVGVGAPHNLVLPRAEATLRPLPRAVALRFGILEGKQVSHERHEGRIVRLGGNQAEIEAEHRPEPLTNLRVRLQTHEGEELPADLYVKVLGSPAAEGAFLVGFTSVPPEAEAFLRDLRESLPA
jgi:adenylate cyclase